MKDKKIKIVVDKNEREIRIDKFLVKKIQNISRNQIQKASILGKILVNKKVINKKNYKVKPLDFIEIEIGPLHNDIINLEYKNILEEKMNLNILYEDEDLIVINKPPGVVVHPGYGNKKGTLINGIKYHLKKKQSEINLYRCGLIHRLDKYTSGLLVSAKNESSQKYLSEQFHKKTIKRKYIALIWGNINQEKGVISGFIGRDTNNRKRMTIYKQNKEKNLINKGKFSITHYKVLERFKYITYISCQLETGRTHQIRAHFKYVGHPLFNDSLYGGNKIFFKKKLSKKNRDFFNVCLNILQRQALHAISLSFIHPKNGIFHFSSPIPKDFKIVLSMCRNQFYYYNNVPCNNI